MGQVTYKSEPDHPAAAAYLLLHATSPRLQIADGCHRVCASTCLEENIDFPRRIAAHEPTPAR